MIKFIKKHPICIAICSVFLIMPFVLYQYYYLTHLRYKPDRGHRQWYQVNLAEKFTQIIEYKTKEHVKYFKCFVLAFEFTALEAKLGFPVDVFRSKYNFLTLTDEQFYSSLIKDKPHFLINIYKEGELIEQKQAYMTTGESSYGDYIGGKRISLYQVLGHFQPRVSACYVFSANSHYTIEVINDTPMPKFEGIDTFFGITHLYSK